MRLIDDDALFSGYIFIPPAALLGRLGVPTILLSNPVLTTLWDGQSRPSGPRWDFNGDSSSQERPWKLQEVSVVRWPEVCTVTVGLAARSLHQVRSEHLLHLSKA